MGKKRYYGYKRPGEHYSITFRNDAEKGKTDMGTLIAMEYDDGLFQLVKIYWGAEEDYERSRNGIVEMYWFFDIENTRKLMLSTGTHDAESMMKTLYERFRCHADFADTYIIKFCDEKDIKYTFCVYY